MDDNDVFEIVSHEPKDIQVAQIEQHGDLTVEDAVARYSKLAQFVQKIMRPDIDYGVVPGTQKNTLYKPGAEKLQLFLGLTVNLVAVSSEEQWSVPITAVDYPLFSYKYEVSVLRGDTPIVSGVGGSCNSYETKYRWRWVPRNSLSSKWEKALEEELLETKEGYETEFDFAIDKAETNGQYGKPQEYWDSWKKAIASGEATETTRKTRKGKEYKAWSRGGMSVRVPNEDIFTQVNTIDKMAQKRAYVAGVISACGASEFFTQDLDDYAQKLDPVVSVYTFVPSREAAAAKLIAHAKSLGAPNAGEDIKRILEENDISFSLDTYHECLVLIENEYN